MLNQTAVAILTSLSGIPVEYTLIRNPPVYSLVATGNLILCTLCLLIFRTIDLAKGRGLPRTHFRLSLGRIHSLLLPTVFSCFSGSIMGCVFACVVSLFTFVALLLTFLDRLTRDQFKALWTLGHLLNTGFWFATLIFVFFQF